MFSIANCREIITEHFEANKMADVTGQQTRFLQDYFVFQYSINNRIGANGFFFL